MSTELYSGRSITVAIERLNGRDFIAVRSRFGGRALVPIDEAAGVSAAIDKGLSAVFDAEASKRGAG